MLTKDKSNALKRHSLYKYILTKFVNKRRKNPKFGPPAPYDLAKAPKASLAAEQIR